MYTPSGHAKGILGCHLPPSLIFLLSQVPNYANIRVLKDIKYWLTTRVTQNCSHGVTERLFHSKHAKSAAATAKLLQSTLCDPIGVSPPGSPVPGILQARTLEWVAISFSNE